MLCIQQSFHTALKAMSDRRSSRPWCIIAAWPLQGVILVLKQAQKCIVPESRGQNNKHIIGGSSTWQGQPPQVNAHLIFTGAPAAHMVAAHADEFSLHLVAFSV